jgi:hypothetical protein
VLDFLEDHTGLSVQTDGRWLIVFRHDKRIAPTEIESWRDEAAQVATVLERAATRG